MNEPRYLVQLNDESGNTNEDVDDLIEAHEIAEQWSERTDGATVDIIDKTLRGSPTGNSRVATYQNGWEI